MKKKKPVLRNSHSKFFSSLFLLYFSPCSFYSIDNARFVFSYYNSIHQLVFHYVSLTFSAFSMLYLGWCMYSMDTCFFSSSTVFHCSYGLTFGLSLFGRLYIISTYKEYIFVSKTYS